MVQNVSQCFQKLDYQINIYNIGCWMSEEVKSKEFVV